MKARIGTGHSRFRAANPDELVTMVLKEEESYPYTHSYQAYVQASRMRVAP